MSENRDMIQEIMMPEYVRNLAADTLPQFCDELRHSLIDIVSRTGGHIGVNLGVVELTTALYHVFDFENDSLVWDIGHQIYIQKMLTGRLPELREIRVNGGSPGYAFAKESAFDRVTSSHAGASLALAIGVMIANRTKGKNDLSIAVIGDGSMVEGSSQEALNHMGVEKGRMLCILNDNEMALDNNFGGLHEYFKGFKPGCDTPETYFSSLGIDYVGPIDGHDVHELVRVLRELDASLNRPTILHIKTVKGKGLEDMADRSPVRIHWNFPFDTETLENTEGPKSKSHAAVFSEALGEILEADDNAYVVTPATLQNTGIFGLRQKYPDRVLDVGMAEQHAITVGSGLALEGMKPVVCFEATFLARAFDQIVHDVCINDLPVMMVAARSGHTGLDHVTHHSMFDLSYLRTVPDLAIHYPAHQPDLKNTVKSVYDNLTGPSLVLFPYGGVIDDPDTDIALDKALDRASGEASNLVLSVGMQNLNAQKLCALLREKGIEIDHVAVTQIAPVNDRLRERISRARRVVTLEENLLDAGLGSLVLEMINDAGGQQEVIRYGFPKSFVEHGTRDYIYRKYGLDAESLAVELLARLG